MFKIDKPATENLLILQGSSFNHVFRLKNPDLTPIDLTGYTARMQIRASKNSVAVLLDLTEGNGRIEIDGIDGKLTLLIDAITTSGLSKGGVYDLEIVLPQVSDPDIVYRIVEGKISISKEVTK